MRREEAAPVHRPTARRPARWFIGTVAAAVLTAGLTTLLAQQVLDRVLARIGNEAVTLTDVKAAVGLGLVDDGSDDEVLHRVIERRLALAEINRMPRIVPLAEDVAAEVQRMRAHAGANLPALLASTGISEVGLEDIARDTLRIRTYLATRFPPAPVSDSDAEAYYREHPEAFRRGGELIPFEEAAATARDAVARERRDARIAQWLNNLRDRADVSIIE